MSQRFDNNPSNDWLQAGGTAFNGMAYGPPSSANAYGMPGCPLVPRIFRVDSGEIELPRALSELVGIPCLKVRELDSTAWQRFPGTSLQEEFLRQLTPLLSDLPVPEQEIVVPAGIPFSWLVALPLSPRLRNALLRHFSTEFANQSFPAAIDCREVLSIRNCGKGALIEMLCVIESVELGCSSDSRPEHSRSSRQRVFTESNFEAAVQQAIHNAMEKASVASLCLKEFSEWALSETEAVTLGSALASAQQSPAAPEVWRVLSELRLIDLVAPRQHPYEVIEIWVSDLPERERTIFLGRIASVDGKATLQDLANRLGVTRERIRQVEKKVAKRFDSHIRKPLGLPVQWRAETIRNAVGIARPLAHIEHLLSSEDSKCDYGHLLLHLAGPYDIRGSWVVSRSAGHCDPTERVLAQCDEFGFIDQDFAATALTEWGLDPSLHTEWLLDTGKLREYSGKLARWDVGIGDKIVAGLADLGEPATLDAILHHIRSDRSRGSAVNALTYESRVVRTSLTEFGLASWGLNEYVSIASSLRELLERSGGRIQLTHAMSAISKAFGVAESSIRTYCSAPMFVVENGWVSLRDDLSTFRYETYSARNSKGVFSLGHGKVSILLEGNEDLLRGSGRPIHPVVGALLDLPINGELVFNYDPIISVSIAFPETSVSPSIGSVRPLAEVIEANLGDHLTLVFDGSDMSVRCTATDISQSAPGWPLVSRLTGIAVEGCLGTLARTLGCREGEVKALLQSRGDEVVAGSMPTEALSSSGIDEALVLLDAQLRRN